MDYRRGIDVSYHQGNIDWASVKASGVEFAMLRAGYGQGNIDNNVWSPDTYPQGWKLYEGA